MGEILGDATLRAQASEADSSDDMARLKEITERIRCLALLRSSINNVEEKVLSGMERSTCAKPAAGEAAFIEVNPDGSPIRGRKTKGSSKTSKKTKTKTPASKLNSIETASGLSIRIG